MGLFRKLVDPFGVTGGDSLFGYGGYASGGDDGGAGGGFNWADLINQYSYMPQYTAEFEKGLYDLFQNTTGLGGGGVEAIPFDIGLPTTGLYDALTRGIKEDYLGTPGGPEGGRIADTRAYYNNLGIPEQAINQERLGNRDLNNLLTDQAALINESQKDRLFNVLNMGQGLGQNAYAQNLGQHRANAGLAMGGAGMDIGLQQAISQANASNLNSLLGAVGTIGGAYFGGPAGAAAGSTLPSLLGQKPSLKRGGNLSNPYSMRGQGFGNLYGSQSNPTANLL